MAFVLATFVGVLTLVLGAYWLFVSRPEQSARAALQHRLRTGRSDTPLAAGLFQRARRLSDIESLNSMLKASAGLADPIQRLIDRAGSTITVGAFLLATAVCFTLPLVATLATMLPSGFPQAQPVWCGCDGTHVLVSTTLERAKGRNMSERPVAPMVPRSLRTKWRAHSPSYCLEPTGSCSLPSRRLPQTSASS